MSNTASYPLAKRDHWYGDANYATNDGRLVFVSPEEYIAAVKPLDPNEEVTRENIELLKEHIEEGGELDPLKIYANGKEDGRHRAYAALELGMQYVPVLAYGKHLPDALECVPSPRSPRPR